MEVLSGSGYMQARRLHLFTVLILLILVASGCGNNATEPEPDENPNLSSERSPKLALWLAKKNELIDHSEAGYDLVMSGWFQPDEADLIKAGYVDSRLLAGLTHTWVFDDLGWQTLFVTVANGGDPNGPLQITDDMFLMFDDNDDGNLDRHCSLPGWPDILAMDPRHTGWQALVQAFYTTVGQQSHMEGVIVDMVDAYHFCDSAWSEGVPIPIDTTAWVNAQDTLMSTIRDVVPLNKWVFANAGRDFPEGSPFPKHVNGYLLENFLGAWGLELEEGLASAQRALSSTQAPHTVVFSVDTNDSGIIAWNRFRTGLVASLLMDNTYFAFDYGPRDHGGVTGWWFGDYYEVVLGDPEGAYTFQSGVYRRDFTNGSVFIAAVGPADVSFTSIYKDTATGEENTDFIVNEGDARIFVKVDGS